MSKTEARLKVLEASLNQKAEALDEQIQRLASLQATVGALPADLNPADAATLADWRENQTEAVSVMEALIAPYHTALGQIREQVNGLVRQMGEFFSKSKADEVFGQLYSRVPKAKLDSLEHEPVFLDFLSRKPNRKRALYVDMMQNTSRYTPDDVLDMLGEFCLATGFDLGLKQPGAGPAQRPAMDSAPRLRSGAALPETPAPPPPVRHP